MDYSRLGRTDIQVSRICLGTMTWGSQNSEDEGHAQMDYALDHGINFFDTAEMYASPPNAETQGSTERIVGTWLKSRTARDKIVLATKVAGRAPMTWLRDSGDQTRLDAANINEAIDKSLKRLQTDYIDLYQVHWPDRPFNAFGMNGLTYKTQKAESIAIEETLEALGALVTAGKVRHIGVSNETAWGTMRYLEEAERKVLPRVQSIQNAYNLLNRTFEQDLAEVSLQENVSLLAYSPLGQGVLTGKYLDGALPAGARKTLYNRIQRYEGPAAERAVRSYVELAHKYDVDPAQLAIKFCDTRPFVTSTIIGATSLAQLETVAAAIALPWTEELEEDVNALHHRQPNPCP